MKDRRGIVQSLIICLTDHTFANDHTDDDDDDSDDDADDDDDDDDVDEED